MDRRAAGIARGGTDNIEKGIVPGQQVFKQITQKLQGNVLECQGWSVEQLEDMQVVQVNVRDHLIVGEGGI